MDIFKIIRKNNVQLFKDAIDVDKSLLYIKDSFGSNLLHKAVFWKCNEIVEYLKDDVKLKDEADNDGYTVYHKACLNNNLEAIKLLGVNETLSIKNFANEMPIITAVKMSHYDIVNFLLEGLTQVDVSYMSKIIGHLPPMIGYYINRKLHIREPLTLYPRDDLVDPYTLEDITPGVLYAFRIDKLNNCYCLGTAETVEIMMKNKYKSTNDNMVFDMVQNQTVPIESILFTVKNDCPDAIKKIFDKTFTEKDIDIEFKDKTYDESNQLEFAKNYKNDTAIKLIESAMKKY
jgi:ankyrin repeat protein